MKEPKVLVGCPTYVGKNYCVHDWIEHIKNLDYENYDIFLVDNTNDDGKNAKWLTETFDVNVLHHYDGSCVTIHELMGECNDIIRKRVIDEKYDYYMSIESDVFPPKDVIQRLMKHNQPICNGVYKIGIGVDKFPLLQGVQLSMIKGKQQPHAQQLSWREANEFLDGTLKTLHGNGIGCSLMRRDLLLEYNLKIDLTMPRIHADSIFYIALWNGKVPVHVDTSVLCRHRNQDWKGVYDERDKEFIRT